jgi:hypothetical protein
VYVTLIASVVEATTDRAVLFDFGDGGEVWVPRSVLEDDDFEEGDLDVEVSVALWFARDKGLA